MTTEETGEPTAQELRDRASRLRDCATRAEKLVEPLGTHVDAEVKTATTPGVWTGTYAGQSTGRLRQYQQDLRGLARDLEESLQQWRNEAERLDDRADEKE
ncbi:hypothetical protein CLV30_12349 [Haloactinopolyspora alba]|uniref:Excreted virulence factor EspC (Type VII ESX diderm) n=1 Tax=Haloactinopolyspora alba TaxID=648780 RepID=A0A2P8DJ49_9ACTN|nr:hypothetical protein [Haloactinopolyspora alba]PSK97250.1 hypothetical protein CLV30_12349 [Haloactinopolyspora alba]